LRSGKVSTWEGGQRVPCLVWAPGRVPAGTTCDRLASTLDMLPTFAALAGAETPRDRVIDGEDISHLLHGRFDEANPDKVFHYYLLTHLQAVRQGPWKLHLPRPQHPRWLGPHAKNRHIHATDDIGMEAPQLYHLGRDMGERDDVAAQHPEVVKRLLALAEAARADIGDHDRVGANMRFFDPLDSRPTVPDAAFLAPKKR
jgi:arylsulfatase A-like enzyme